MNNNILHIIREVIFMTNTFGKFFDEYTVRIPDTITASMISTILHFMNPVEENKHAMIKFTGSERNKMVEFSTMPLKKFERQITFCIKFGLIFKAKFRGEYYVNPWLISKGKESDITKSRESFIFDEENNKWLMIK